MKVAHNAHKIIIFTILLLVGSDVSLLFAAGDSNPSALQFKKIQPTQHIQQNQQNPQAEQSQQHQQRQQNQSNQQAQHNPAHDAQTPAKPTEQPGRFQQLLKRTKGFFTGEKNKSAAPSADDLQQKSALQQIRERLEKQEHEGAKEYLLPRQATQTTTQRPLTQQASQMQQNPVFSEEARTRAFESLENKALPMTPKQIQQLHRRLDVTQRAAAAPPHTPPRPVSSSLIVNLSPGTTPPVVRLATGFVTSIDFVDATGGPWPIQSFVIGNPNAFNVNWDKKSNSLSVQPIEAYPYGNLKVTLAGLPTPVMVTLTTGQVDVDYRAAMRIQAIGPNPNQNIIGDGLPAKADPLLLHILNGVAPEGSQLMKIDGSYTKAWLFQDKLYIRTRHRLLSPGWSGSMSSADGTKAYELPRTSLVLMSVHGKVQRMRISGFK